MSSVTLVISTAIIFLIMDSFMLKKVLFPIFSERLGTMLLDEPRMVVAGLFYLVYVIGLVWFVSLPAMQNNAPYQALLNGALFGLVAYGTYEITNYATLRPWSLVMVAVDLSWGVTLTAVSAFGGVLVTRALFG